MQAKVKLSWKRSISSNVKKRVVNLEVDGVSQSIEVGTEDTELVYLANPNTTLVFRTVVTSTLGVEATSEPLTFPVGDFSIAPDTDLAAEVVEVVPDSVPTN